MAKVSAADVQAFRQRNREAGLCACGRPRRPPDVKRSNPKTCARCRDYGRTQYRKRPEVAVVGVTFQSQHDPSTVAEWNEFCTEFGMPLNEALETAMELLIAVTRRAEQEQESQSGPVLKLVG